MPDDTIPTVLVSALAAAYSIPWNEARLVADGQMENARIMADVRRRRDQERAAAQTLRRRLGW